MAQYKVIISGVGRSGTSFLFEEVAATLNSLGPSKFFYEPYLWAPQKVNRLGRVSAEPFDTRNLSPFGIHVHCASPLFLEGAHPVHDQMIRHIFANDGHVMTKMIRGNGRLRAFMASDPEIRVVGIVRDVIGTVNSAANHFSFFGEEFHPTDRPRFRDEVIQSFGATLSVPDGNEATRQAVWSALWWKYMTLALLNLQRDLPERVCLVDYGSLLTDPDAAYARLEGFLGIPLSLHRLKMRVGLTSSANYLDGVDLKHISPYHDWLRRELSGRNCVFQRSESPSFADFDKVLARYSSTKPGVVPRYPLFRTGVSWRFALARKEAETSLMVSLYDESIRANTRAVLARSGAVAPAVQDGTKPSVSVVVPVWNAADTLERALAAVWGQVGVDAEVIVVDDLSTDGTAELAERLLEKGPGRLVRNTRNLGPGMSRHKGILNARHDLISTIDADDYMMPFKLAAEVEALGGDPSAVAFSDVVYRRNGGMDRWTFEDVSGLKGRELLPLIAGRRARIPRDMTFHRRLYQRTRGFETMLRMYEDWSFKLELAATASRWVTTGELGLQYEHKQTGASAGTPAKHRFFLHAAFLKHGEMLAMQYGHLTIGMLRDALSNFGVPDSLADGLSTLERRTRFNGYLVEDLVLLRKNVHRMVFRQDVSYEDRLSRAYDAVFVERSAL